jgi:hypothetical protein
MSFMPYVSFEIEFESPKALHDLNGPIGILKTVLGVIVQENLRGYNFNRYYSPEEGLYHPNMDLRVNLVNVEESIEPIRKALQEFVQKGVIRYFRPDPKSWEEPQFVVDAHEASTRCAISFVEGLNNNRDLMQYAGEHPREFMRHFVRLLLQLMGLTPHVAWTHLRTPPPAGLNTLAQSCARLVSSSFSSQMNKADFLERFLHTFFNCTVGAMEGEVIGVLSNSLFWNELAQS